MGERYIRLRRVASGTNHSTRVITIPGYVARAVPEDAWFEATLTDEGILLRFVGRWPFSEGRQAQAEAPDWAKED